MFEIFKFKKSLGTKFIVWLSIALITTFGIVTIMNIAYQQKILLQREDESVRRLVDTILTSILHPMLTGDQEQIQLQFDEFKKLKGVNVLHLIDHDGIIKRSTDHSLIGEKSLAKGLQEALEGKKYIGLELRERTKQKIYSELAPIMNEESCYACHGSKHKVLGVVRAAADWAPVDEVIIKLRNRNIVMSVVSLLFINLLIFIFLFKMVIRPIQTLVAGTKKIASGDLSYQIRSGSEDEIGELTESFNQMTQNLKISRNEIEQSNIRLEQKVSERTKELQEARNSLEIKVQERTEELVKINETLRTEIAERKKTEERLLESEEKFSKISTSAKDGIIMIDNEGNISYWNEAAERIFGYSREEAIGKECHLFLAPERYHEACIKGYEKFKTTGQGPVIDKTLELMAIRKGGAEIPIELSISAVNLKGKWNAIGIARDITERKKAEETLRETRDYLESLVNYTNAPIIVWDTNLKITRSNHAFERLTGYPISEVIGQELRILFPEANRDELMNKIAFSSSGEYWESVEIPILCKDGNIRLILWNSANIYTKDGKTLLATIAQGTDITERKKAEEEQRQLMKDLEETNRIMTGRELRMIELKEEVNKLSEELGRSKPYV